MTNSYDRGGPGFEAYLRDISRHSLLTREQNMNLARIVVSTRIDLWCAILDYVSLTGRTLATIIEAGAADGLGDECEALSGAAYHRSIGQCGDAEFAGACRKLATSLAYRKGIGVARRIVAAFPATEGDPYDIIAQSDLLCRLLRKHDAARQRFATVNLRLVVSVAKSMRGWLRALPIQDLVQEGSVGILRAIDTFDPRRGIQFSTYGCWWIRHMMIRGAVDRGRLVRVPQHMHDLAYRLLVCARAIAKKTGEWPTPEETAEAAGIELSKAARAYDVFGTGLRSAEDAQVVSMDSPMFGPCGTDDERENGRGPAPIGETAIPHEQTTSDEQDDVETIVDTKQSAEAVVAVVESDVRDDRERHILRSGMGLGVGGAVNLDVLGVELHLSRERVRQLEMRALSKVRSAMGVVTPRAA